MGASYKQSVAILRLYLIMFFVVNFIILFGVFEWPKKQKQEVLMF